MSEVPGIPAEAKLVISSIIAEAAYGTKMQNLIDQGVEFIAQSYLVKAVYKGKTYHQNVTFAMKSLYQGNCSPLQLEENQVVLKTFIDFMGDVVATNGKPKQDAAKMVFSAAGSKVVTPGGVEIMTTPEHAAKLEALKPAGYKSPQMVLNLTELLKKEVEKNQPDSTPVIDSWPDTIMLDAVNKLPLTPVKLGQATQLGQPVYGTSPGSVYHVVAMNSRVKMAIRRSGKSVSVRVETMMASQKELGRLNGFAFLNASTGYWSGHFTLGGGTKANRLFGAMLLDLGIPMNQLCLDPEMFGEN